MLIMVRLIPPGDYGRATAVVAVLSALNTLSFGMFTAHALQLPDDRKPEWSLHWTAGFYLQTMLFLICEGVAVAFWTSALYRSVAGLLHVAGIGFLLAWPNQFAITMLYRDLDFARLKTISAIGTISKITCTIALAYAGQGALGIVCGNNVVSCLPFGFDLLVIRGWRPKAGWWRWPDWSRYAAPARFGFQRMTVSLAAGLRGALEAAVLPSTLGFASIGLVNRAGALYATTVGRLQSIVIDTVYPFLPRASNEPARYGRRAMLLVQMVLMIVIPTACFIAFEGASLSRVVYGVRWIAADPLIMPATIGSAAITVAGLASTVLLGAGLLRRSLILDVVTMSLMAGALLGASVGRTVSTYAWSLAVGQTLAAILGFAQINRVMPGQWLLRSAIPPFVTSAVGTAIMLMGHWALIPGTGAKHVVEAATLFGLTVCVVLRTVFGSLLVQFFDELGWNWPQRLLMFPIGIAKHAPSTNAAEAN